jgi:hypothetical protein
MATWQQNPIRGKRSKVTHRQWVGSVHIDKEESSRGNSLVLVGLERLQLQHLEVGEERVTLRHLVILMLCSVMPHSRSYGIWINCFLQIEKLSWSDWQDGEERDCWTEIIVKEIGGERGRRNWERSWTDLKTSNRMRDRAKEEGGKKLNL